MVLQIIGWVVLVALAIVFSVATVFVLAFQSAGWGGGRDLVPPATVAAVLWAAAYSFAPFSVVWGA